LRRIGGTDLRDVVKLLEKLEELVTIIERRGIDFAEFLGKRRDGKLPAFRTVVEGEEQFHIDAAARDEYLREQNLVVADEDLNRLAGANGNGQSNGQSNGHAERRLQKNQELHEVKELTETFEKLSKFGLNVDDYYLTQEESVSGEKLATRYALASESTAHEVAGVAQILPEILRLGKHGIEVKRFKGLGEMNSEELWETTLDPNKRVLLRVTLQEAGEAERMFSVLMGEDVERRRQFIEDHALEVKNLDV
jgi:DNA gyrase subunit B